MPIKGYLRVATTCTAALLTLPTASVVAGDAPERTAGEHMTTETVSGIKMLSVRDPVQKASIPLVVFYPTSEEPSKLRFGPFGIEAARDAQLKGRRLPLVVISHGSRGNPWTMRDLAMALARAGFVAVFPDHLGDSSTDSSAYGTSANLENRPRHIKLATDAMMADAFFGNHLRPDAVGAIGLSMGGYSVLASSGGKPWTGPQESGDGPYKPVEVTRDPRIKALVLLAPATPWFTPEGSLSDVDIPVMMWTGAQDIVTPPFHSNIVRRDIDRTLLQHVVVPNAGHFSFMSSFPPEMRASTFAPSQDPPGFDRDAYGRTLAREISSFLHRSLNAK